MVSDVMSWPTVEFVVSTREVFPVTVTTSLTEPTFRAMFTVVAWSTSTSTPFANGRFKTLLGGADVVFPGSEGDKGVDAPGAGNRGQLCPGSFPRRRYRRSRDDRPARISHQSADRAAACLCHE